MAEYRVRIDTTSDRALEFVNGLAFDDEFRLRLTEDPQSVLFDYGVEVSDELIPGEVSLPSKEAVQQALEQGAQGSGVLPVGPESFFPVFICFFSFPFLADTSTQS
jgi:hypothetical protein